MKPTKALKLILASQSPRRKEILSYLGVPFKVRTKEIDEEALMVGDPEESILSITCAKLDAVVSEYKLNDHLVIAADTIVMLQGRVFGKPKDRADAFAMLSELSGKEHLVKTCFALYYQGKVRFSQVVTTRVQFLETSPTHLNHYLDTASYADKAGAYAIQEHGMALVDKIDGSFTNVVGLPVEELTSALKSLLKELSFSFNDFRECFKAS